MPGVEVSAAIQNSDSGSQVKRDGKPMPRKSGSSKMKSVSHSVLAIVRAQASSENGVCYNSDAAAVVSRIAMTLATPETCTGVLRSVFNEYSKPATHMFSGVLATFVSGGGRESADNVHMLDMQNLPQVYDHWMIPHELIFLFWAMWRKLEGAWELQQMPSSIGLDQFQAVMVKVLRRVRDRYCGNKLNKGSFVIQNRLNMEDEYAISMSCGAGNFGECFWVTHRLSKKKRVCKRLSKDAFCLPVEEVPEEFRILQELDHPNIMNIFEWFETPTHYLMIVEPAYGGDLKHLMAEARFENGRTGLPEDLVRAIAVQALQALAYIHSKSLMHRDVKPANMLLAQPLEMEVDHLQILLADFGVAEFFAQDSQFKASVMRGTVGYMSPEVFENLPCPRSDVWALGVVVYEMLCGQRPYKPENALDMFALLKEKAPDFQAISREGASDSAVKCLQRMLVSDPQKRSTAMDLLHDTWLSQSTASSTLSSDGRHSRKMRKSLATFMNTGHFARVALNCIAAQLDKRDVDRLAKMFAALDTDHSGTLSPEELSVGLNELGVDAVDVTHVADTLDINCDGAISYSEFIASLLQAQGRLFDEMIYHGFQTFDVNKNGTISLDELALVLSGDGPLLSYLPDGKSVAEVLAEIDTSGDGVISLSEFKAYIQRVSQGGALAREALASQGTAPLYDRHAEQEAQGCSMVTLAPLTPKTELPSPRPTPDLVDQVNWNERLQDLFIRWAPALGRSREEMLSWAMYLADRHWLETPRDLCKVKDSEWERLDLPMKLESLLRGYVSGANIEEFQVETSTCTTAGRAKDRFRARDVPPSFTRDQSPSRNKSLTNGGQAVSVSALAKSSLVRTANTIRAVPAQNSVRAVNPPKASTSYVSHEGNYQAPTQSSLRSMSPPSAVRTLSPPRTSTPSVSTAFATPISGYPQKAPRAPIQSKTSTESLSSLAQVVTLAKSKSTPGSLNISQQPQAVPQLSPAQRVTAAVEPRTPR